MVKLEFSRGRFPKKYKVVIKRKGQRDKVVQFGDQRYQQYEDKTPLKLYKSKNHFDKRRRTNYRKRHNYKKPLYSAGWFARKYLW